MSGNVYFELTRAFNAAGPIAALASGQAVVYYRIAIMSKDGDRVIRDPGGGGSIYARAAEGYLAAFVRVPADDRRLPAAHARVVALAERMLPPRLRARRTGMPMLSDDDVNLVELSDEELDLAWDLWFDLAQSTNDADPPYTHGVFTTVPSCRPDDR